jgi:F-type H+-transporting ATPase subunit b
LIVQIVNFIAFLTVMNVIFFRPVAKAIAERRAYVDSLGENNETMLARIREFRQAANERRASARREADELKAQVRAQAGAEAEQISVQFTARASAVIATAHQTVAEEVRTAHERQDDLAQQIAATLLGNVLGSEKAA